MVGSTPGWTNNPILLDSFEFFSRPTAVNQAHLTDLYVQQGLTFGQIAEKLGVAKSTALDLLKKAEVRRSKTQGRTQENYRLRPPFGWHVIDGKLTRNREEMRAVRFSQRLHQEDGLGSRAIARALSAHGLRNRAGQAFGNQTVQRMLSLPLNKKN